MHEMISDINWILVLIELLGGSAILLFVGYSLVNKLNNKREENLRGQQLSHLRNTITTHYRRVMKCRGIASCEFPLELGQKLPNGISADEFRVDSFNHFLRELHYVLEYQSSKLTPMEKKDVLDAVDWFHKGDVGHVLGVPTNGKFLFPIVNKHNSPIQQFQLGEYYVFHEGRWPLDIMTKEQAEEKFVNLRKLQWLSMPPRLIFQW